MSDGADDKPNIEIGAIARAPIELPPVEAPQPQQNPLTGKDEKLGQHLGWIGRFVGGGPEKAGNIAAIVIIVALVALVVAGIASGFVTNEVFAPVFDKLITGCLSLITGALGYLFGSSRESK